MPAEVVAAVMSATVALAPVAVAAAVRVVRKKNAKDERAVSKCIIVYSCKHKM